ncbi:MAG: transcription termination factor NusA [Pseudomonadota bacterium]
MGMFEELTKVIEQFGRDKGIDRKMVVEAIEIAMVTAAKKKMGPHIDVEAHYSEETGEIELFQFKTVVEDGDVADPDIEVELQEAQKEDPNVELGDSVGVKLDSAQFGRIAAQTAKQVINQKIRDAEREIIYSEFLARKGEIISGMVRRFERGTVVVDLGKTEAFLPPREQIPGEQYRIGDRIQAYLLDVQQTSKGPQIILSRATPLYLIKLFEMEVPEIYEGIVTIKSAARDPGARAKIAVTSRDKDVDPVGACVGVRGARVQNIVAELKGERIDIIPYQTDIAKFACSALAPAEVSKVMIDEDNRYMEVIVPDAMLSLAIGRRGQNVRLAAQLTGWKIDVVGETSMAQRYEDAKFSLTQIPNISETIATALFQNGYKTVFEVAEANPADLIGIPGFETEESAKSVVERSKEVVQSGKVIIKTQDEKFTVVGKKTADEMLREEMQQLLEKEKEHLLGADNELLKVKGMGPSLMKVLSDAGIDKLEKITAVERDAFINDTTWENKDELGVVYDSAVILYNERLITEGKKDDMSDEEKQKFQSITEATKSVLLRLAAAGFTTAEAVKSVSKEDFIKKTGLDETRAVAIYDGVNK